MSTTDTSREAFKTWHLNKFDVLRPDIFEGGMPQGFRWEAWQAALEWQAATEAAKATGTAQTKQSFENIEELVPLPEEIEIGGDGWGWEDFQSWKTFSVEHMLYYGAACAQAAFAEAARQPEAAKAASTVGELPPPDYIAGTKGMLCENAWSRETVEAYGQACAEAAWNNCATLNQERIRQLTDAEAARQPAPVVSNDLRNAAQLIMDLYDDMRMGKQAIPAFDALRAALAATAAPVLSDEQILANETLKYYFGLNGGKGPVSDKGHNIIQAVLTVATRGQP